jgi:hypothetical protein
MAVGHRLAHDHRLAVADILGEAFPGGADRRACTSANGDEDRRGRLGQFWRGSPFVVAAASTPVVLAERISHFG